GGLPLAEGVGGVGHAALEGTVLYEELGRALAPTPHFVSAVLAGGALAEAGRGGLKQTWLPRIVSGETILSVAWLEPDGTYRPQGVQTRATADGDGFTLTGT